MKNFNLSNLLIPLLAAIAAYFPLSNMVMSEQKSSESAQVSLAMQPATATPTPKSTAPPTSDTSRVPGEAAKLLCDFFGLEPVPDEASRETEPEKARRKTQSDTRRPLDAESYKGDYCRIRSNWPQRPTKFEIKSLIVTIPDPKESRLDHLFDRHLDAIERAIESAGYTFDRYSLPWDKVRGGGQMQSPNAQEAAQKMGQSESRYLREPGVVLFRGGNRLLLLYLVGETPTSGIHKVAFQNALWQVERIEGWAESQTIKASSDKSVTPKLSILGPTFSGSAQSMAMTLRAWLGERKGASSPEIEIVSGSATAIDRGQFLNGFGKSKVSFYATVVQEQETFYSFFKYLSDTTNARVAMLSEGSTSYGQWYINWVKKYQAQERGEKEEDASETPPPPPPPPPAGHNQPARDEDSAGLTSTPTPSPTPVKKPPSILNLTFPLHISQLRIESAKNKPSRNDTANTLEVKDNNLALPMTEGGNPGAKDVIAPFSPLEPVTTELSLDEILSEISREQIRYVGLSSTDAQDRIFLTHEIRKHCPNVVIFTLSSDLLYLHSEANLDFRGTLVVSPYPLFGLNQMWTFPFLGNQFRRQFTTQSAQGCYNAALRLLGEEEKMLEFGAPFESYSTGGSRRPALWLSIVGRDGIWPVKTLEPDSQAEANPYTLRAMLTGQAAHKDVHNRVPRLELTGSYMASAGLGFLLAIGFVCLVPPLMLLAQLILFKVRNQVDPANPEQWKLKRSKIVRGVIERLLRLETDMDQEHGSPLLRWVRRGWLGQIFGDEEFYRYRLDRRVYLMACCVSLLTIALFISSVAVLPEWMKRGAIPLEIGWRQRLLVGFGAYFILVCTVAALLWLAASIIGWMISGARDFLGYFQALAALFAGATLIVFEGRGLWEIFQNAPLSEQVFFFLRSTDLANGVSLLTPVLLIGLAAFLSFFAAVRRLNLAERMPCLREPQQKTEDTQQFLFFEHEKTKSFEGLKALENRVKEMLVCGNIAIPGAVAAALLIFAVYWRLFLWHFIPSVDGLWFDRFFKLSFYLIPMLLIWAFMRFFWLGMALRKLLRRLSWHPLISQYAAEHSGDKRFASLPPLDLMTPTPTYTALSFSVRQARVVYRALKLSPAQAEMRVRIKGLVEEAESKLALALQFDAKGDWQEAMQNRRDSQAALARLTEPITELLEEEWRRSDEAMPDKTKETGERRKEAEKPEKAKEEGEANDWREEGKFFLVAHIVAFLQYIFAHLQNLVALVTIGLLLVLLAANSYPFQPSEPLLLFSWVTILTTVLMTLFIFVQMGRDKTLSLLTGTTPGKLNLTSDFVVRVLIHGVAPVIALLGAQFPEVLRRLFSWLSVFDGKGH